MTAQREEPVRRIGFVGLGNLGLPMATTAVSAGFEVVGFDLRAEPNRRLEEAGGRAGSSLEEVADADLLALAVLDDVQVTEVVEQLHDRLPPGTVIAVHSTVLPETILTLGERVAADDLRLLDVPVSGGDVAAKAGTLTLMVGGADAALARARPYFEAVGSNVCHLGPLGAGAAGKLANQLMTFVNQLGALEAMKLAALYEVDESQVIELGATSTSDSWILRNWGFFDRIFSEYEASGTPPKLRPWAKDLWDVMVVARENELSLPLAALAAQLTTPMFGERGGGV